jgi:hypothetical protein
MLSKANLQTTGRYHWHQFVVRPWNT